MAGVGLAAAVGLRGGNVLALVGDPLVSRPETFPGGPVLHPALPK